MHYMRQANLGGGFDDFLRDPLRILIPPKATREGLADMVGIAAPLMMPGGMWSPGGAFGPDAGAGGFQGSQAMQQAGMLQQMQQGFGGAFGGAFAPPIETRPPVDPALIVIPVVALVGVGVAWFLGRRFRRT